MIFIASFILGFAVTIAEPDLRVLAQTVPHINNTVLLVTVGVGVGFFLCVCMIRILTGVRLGKGTTSPESEKFLGVSIAKEKEVILIVARKEQKADIMRSIMTRAGADTDAGAVVFSVPVSEVAGFGMFDET